MARCIVPLAAWILLSGLDDLFVALVWLIRTVASRRAFSWPSEQELDGAEQRRIAMFVPLWHEHRVIGQMLERNLAAIRYANYDVFVGVYRNDPLTVRAVAEAAARDPRVHSVSVPHDGPTSKGDCLNWIYRGMSEHEDAHGLRFEIVMVQDAEDLIDPESMRIVNWYSRDFQMIQIPVLALPTGFREFTHGLYCDEFADFQGKDIPVRQWLGGFLPGNGVGTGFDREALDRVARESGTIFNPRCLTEDYDIGYRLFMSGCRQLFVPLRFGHSDPVATREYFPRNLRAAVRQRSRWVAGIALQGWQHHGWRVPPRQLYWFWRDRKGLVGNLLAPATNLVFLYGLVARLAIPPRIVQLCAATMGITLLHAVIRTVCSARVYGIRFASLAPLRTLWGNLINWLATAAALLTFVDFRLRRQRLIWRKTEHIYPADEAPTVRRTRIGEVLVRLRAVSAEAVEHAAGNQPASLRLGEYLVHLQQISEENLYRALSLQAGIPLGLPRPDEVSRHATRILPAEASRRWKVLPYRLDFGELHLVTPEPPSAQMKRELQLLSTLELRFRLVRPVEFQRLTRKYWPRAI